MALKVPQVPPPQNTELQVHPEDRPFGTIPIARPELRGRMGSRLTPHAWTGVVVAFILRDLLAEPAIAHYATCLASQS